MLYVVLIYGNIEARLSEDTLESIVDQMSVPTSAQINVGTAPSFIYISSFIYNDFIYVANSDTNTVSVIDPNKNTVIETIHVEDGPIFI